MARMKNVLILGIGNLFLNDAGVGIHIIHMLKSMSMPDDVDLLDGGTDTVKLLDTMQQYKHLILIDAAIDNNPPGTVQRLSPRISTDYPQLLNNHHNNLYDIIAALNHCNQVPSVELLAISVSNTPTIGVQLSPEVRRVIPQVMQLIFEILDDMHRTRYYR